MHLARRGFILGGLASAFAAPAIVRAGSLMPIRAPKLITSASERIFIVTSISEIFNEGTTEVTAECWEPTQQNGIQQRFSTRFDDKSRCWNIGDIFTLTGAFGVQA